MKKVTGLVVFLLGALTCAAETRPDRWAVILSEPPVARQLASRAELTSAAAVEPRRRIEIEQATLRQAASEHGVRVLNSISTLLNAVFVSGSEAQVHALRELPGVQAVVKMVPIKRHLNKALDLVNTSAAWSALGGSQNAGAGIKIGIIDSGIDQTHPAFQDPALATPPGYPLCRAQDCGFTNSKVIVARSYVDSLAAGNGTPQDSRPDDLTPRDRIGHGTALAMIAAGASVPGPAATISGVAPKAWLGNYKVFGSPGVNDFTFSDTILTALNDALQDGMDVVTLSLGIPAQWSYKDFGTTCGSNRGAGQPCDYWTNAVETAAAKGLTIVASAGNDGDLGYHFPNLNSINTPGTAPSIITVGASTNAHTLFATARLPGAGAVDSSLNPAYALFTDGPPPNGAIQAPIVDVTSLGDDGTACSALGRGSLNGAVALIATGGACGAFTKVSNAQASGAAAALFYRTQNDAPFRMTGLATTGIPSAVIGKTAGLALKAYLSSNAGSQIILDPGLVEYTGSDFVYPDEIAYFSSEGPAIGDLLIKPELVAPGTGLYVATQTYDPNGDMFDPSGFTVQQGTSFSAALVTGAVALVKQHLPRATAGQLKSAVVNTADGSHIVDFDANGQPVQPARVTAMGAGKLNVSAAVATTVTVEPATISFGEVSQGATAQRLKLTNLGNSTVNLNLSVNQRDADSNGRVSVTPSSVQLGAGQSAIVTVSLTGSPLAGSYEGAISIQGGPVPLRAPYLYIVSDRTADNVYLVQGFDWTADAGSLIELDFRAIDRFGAPVSGVAHKWSPAASVDPTNGASKSTDSLGFGYAVMVIPRQTGEAAFSVDIPGFPTQYFPGRVTLPPSIQSNGVVNAASGTVGQGVAPGSYISIYGSSLSPSTRQAVTYYLPVSLAGVSVSFDVPSKKLSLPGKILFVSSGRVDVQVPWELQGLNTVQMKVSIGLSQSALYDVPLTDYAPAVFEIADANGRNIAQAWDENNAAVTSANPAIAGHTVSILANGLGPVDNQPPTGELSPSQPLATTKVQPTVTIGGQQAGVISSALMANQVGYYLLTVTIPQGAGSGPQPVVITANGAVSKPSNLVLQ